MKKTGVLTLTVLILAGGLFWSLLSGGRLAPSVWAKPEPGKVDVPKWEYCALTGVGNKSTIGNDNVPYANIVYYTGSGRRSEELESPGRDPMAAALAKLGAEGWEMVGPSPASFNGSDASNLLFFKRPMP